MMTLDTAPKKSSRLGYLVLVVDDALEVRELLMGHLGGNELEVVCAAKALEIKSILSNCRPKLVLLDVQLSDADGVALAKDMHLAERCRLIFVTLDARRERDALNVGADDCITKPIDLAMVDARIHNSLHRAPDPRMKFDGWSLDVVRRELFKPDGALQSLTAGEMNILVALAAHSPTPLSRDYLLDVISNRDPRNISAHTVDNLIVRLRKKMSSGGHKAPIITLRGEGYALRPKTNG